MRKLRLKLGPGVRRAVLAVLITVAVGYAAFASLILWAMRQPPETFGKVMARLPGRVPFLIFPLESAWLHARAGSLRVGDQAPDFSLMKQDKSARVQLSTITSRKPVVLIFGSYT